MYMGILAVSLLYSIPHYNKAPMVEVVLEQSNNDSQVAL